MLWLGMLSYLWQWVLETLDLLLMDKSDYPILTLILLGRIALICAIIGCPFVIWGYIHKVRQWRRVRPKGNTDA